MRFIALGIIPARSGSKSIPGKNLYPVAGKPLLAYTIEAAQESRSLSRCILSTNDPEIAQFARSHGVEVPFLRPAALAEESTPTLPVITHALEWLASHEASEPDIIVLLQPTSPLRKGWHIDEAVQRLIDSGADSVVSVSEVPGQYNPHWQFALEGEWLRVFTGEPLPQLVPRRQDLPLTYTRNGALYVFWRRTLQKQGSIYGQCALAYVMPRGFSVNIDSMLDIALAEELLGQSRLKEHAQDRGRGS